MHPFARLGFAARLGTVLLLILTLPACGGGQDGASETPRSLGTTAAAVPTAAPAGASETISDEAAVSAASNALSFSVIAGANSDPGALVSDLILPVEGPSNTLIAWSSSDPSLLSNAGEVNRPAPLAGDSSLVLAADITRGQARALRQFVLTLLALPAGEAEAVAADAQALVFDSFRGTNPAPDQITSSLPLPATGSNGSRILWSSDAPSVIAPDGTLTRPSYLQGDALVSLSASLSLGQAGAQKSFALRVPALPDNDAAALSLDLDWLGFETIRGANGSPAAVTENLSLPQSGPNGSSILWRSDHPAISDAGLVTRQESGNSAVTLGATLNLGGQSASQQFELVVLGAPQPADYRLPRSGLGVFHLESPTEEGAAAVGCTLDLGPSPKEVYLVITNHQETDAASYPLLESAPELLDASQELALAKSRAREQAELAKARGEGLDCPQDIALFNSDPWYYGDLEKPAPLSFAKGRSLPAYALEPVQRDQEGWSETFYDSDNRAVAATCRKVVSDGNRTLNIWVADDSWSGAGCDRANCVEQSQVEVLADRFLAVGADNDIYDWVTGIYGQEWGNHGYSSLIADDGNISILLFDIEGDNSTLGGALGYFHSRNCFRASTYPTSNERLMFALDSVLFATAEGGSWNATDRWPQRLLSTLAHEFQHMIHFYQKQVVQAGASTTWLNEMSSMVTQDLVETRMQVDGPRGLPWSDGSAGASGNSGGRLPRFVAYDYLPLAHWFRGSTSGEDNVLNSYAVNYAFGAYLARNFGGAAFFRDLVRNPHGGVEAIDAALAAGGFVGEDFASVLQKWGAAALLSDRSSPEVPPLYRYNSGGYFDASLDGMRFELGSINLYNYRYGTQSGPRIFTGLPQTGMAGRYKTSNCIVRVGSNLSGLIRQDITLAQGTRATLVVK